MRVLLAVRTTLGSTVNSPPYTAGSVGVSCSAPVESSAQDEG
jgi:hypothetical protein